MITVHYVERDEFHLLDNFEGGLEAALTDIRRVWHESDESAVFTFTEDGKMVATMIRYASDANIAHTLYANGEYVKHHVKYVLDCDGCYLGTAIDDCNGNGCFYEYGWKS